MHRLGQLGRGHWENHKSQGGARITKNCAGKGHIFPKNEKIGIVSRAVDEVMHVKSMISKINITYLPCNVHRLINSPAN